MNKCKKCGRTIPDGDKYCVSCSEVRDQKGKFWAKVGAGAAAVLTIIGIGIRKAVLKR